MSKIIIIVLVAFAVFGTGYGISKIDWQAISQDETSQVEDSTLSDIEKTSKIDNQKITGVNGKEITLENGSKFTAEKSDCQVGDVIQGYDDEKNSLICAGTVDNKTVTRYVSVPQNNNNDLLTNLILVDYFLGRGNLRNNGYAPTYVNNTTVYKGSNGAEITSNKGSKPTTTKSPTSSKSSNGKSSSSNGGRTTSSGHGGGFGKGSSGNS